MQNPTKLKQYRTTLYNKLKDILDANNTEGEWERIKEAIKQMRQIEVKQTQNRTPRNERWDEECRQYIKKKIKARSK
jgi:ribonuclease HI